MAKVTNVGGQDLFIAGERVKPNGSIEIAGKISKSLRILEGLGALEIEGGSDDVGSDAGVTIVKVNNPEPPPAEPKADTQDEGDAKVIAVIQELAAEAFMADGRPEVRPLNEALSKAGLNNVTAAERDRLWDLAKPKE